MKRKRSNKQSSREAAPPTSSIASLAAPTALKEEDLVKIEQVVKEELAENNLK